jgi:hypothetical protein
MEILDPFIDPQQIEIGCTDKEDRTLVAVKEASDVRNAI